MPQDSASLSKQVDYWISRLDIDDPYFQHHVSVPMNQEARESLIKLGEPAVPYIIKAVDEGRAGNTIAVCLVLRDITGLEVDYPLKSQEGPRMYLEKIREWLAEKGYLK
jgi:hypothetical protein